MYMIIASLVLTLVGILISACVLYPDGASIASVVIIFLSIYSAIRIWPVGEKLIENKGYSTKLGNRIINCISFFYTVYAATSIGPKNYIIFIMILTIFVAPFISKGFINSVEICENDNKDVFTDPDVKVWSVIAIITWLFIAILLLRLNLYE